MAASNSVDSSQLQIYVERIERVNAEIKELQDDRKDIYAEAKSQGYDVRTMRAVVAQRALEKEVREARRLELDTYLQALGLL